MAEHKPLYLWSSKEAHRNGEPELWKESFQENCRCARAIEDAIKVNFDGTTLNTDCVRDVIEEFGFDRTNWVLANTVRQKKEYGSFEYEKRFDMLFETVRKYGGSVRLCTAPPMML